ncbi:MAG: SDR family oxidoreductase [Planctomycetota bacterium]|jgi:dTDP-glucose 4,6-dehydratase|nr:SDR family oxidoreductase [Planctomycetota bacterium]
MLTAVITGGAGFLGSYLCDRFLAAGMRVVAVDNLCTGRRRNLEHLASNPNFSFLRHDICEPIPIAGAVDYVLNFASPASPPDYLRLPLETLMVGALGARSALELAREKGARFLHASTSECYGDPLVNPQNENYWGNVNPIGQRSVYDEAKRFAEALTMAYHREHQVATRLARIFNTYGPRMRLDDGRALPTFMAQALRGEPLTVYGDGSQTRSFQYVDDLIEGVWRLLHSDEVTPVNIGNPEEVSMLAFAREIIELTGSKSEIVFQPLPPDDPKLRCPDIAKARRILDWEPRVQRREGLQRTVEYFQREATR